MGTRGAIAAIFILAIPFSALTGWAQFSIDLEEAPIHYSETEDCNAVSRLMDRVQSGEVILDYDLEFGYLRALLEELDIAVSSQVLVFSKTSLQVRHITRQNPRAIYFNDETYVGWVRGSSLMEISTTDPALGAVFYALDMKPWQAKFRRAGYDCLGCHATSLTGGIPGHTVRSVLPNADGSVDPQLKSFITDHTSPFEQRWGGWYVTGFHGEMTHMGNAFLRGGMLDQRDNGNLLSLRDQFHVSEWLTPNSDIVALMVLEHQTQMHNLLTRANFTVRKLFHDMHGGDESQEAVAERDYQISDAARDVVEYMLFCGEARLTSEVKGSIKFASEFVARGPRDQQKRSLRDLDLKTRLFRYPCSYLIYSSSFDALHEKLRQEIYRQLWDVFNADSVTDKYQHLTLNTRREILDILLATKSDLPAYWK